MKRTIADLRALNSIESAVESDFKRQQSRSRIPKPPKAEIHIAETYQNVFFRMPKTRFGVEQTVDAGREAGRSRRRCRRRSLCLLSLLRDREKT